MAPVDVADSLEMEMAWYLLTVVVRLGRPAAASDLAAAAIPPRMVERMCRVPESPLCLSDGGAVTASQTAIVAFLRLVGLDIPAPRVSLRPYDVRRWWGEMSITYVRKRKAWDAGRSGGKKFCFLAPEIWWSKSSQSHFSWLHKAVLLLLMESKSHQLIAQNSAPVADGETAIMAFLRLVGLDVPVHRVSLRPCDVRRRWGEMLITYVRKRKAGDAGRSCGKRFLLLAPDADLVEHEQPKSLQLATQSCPPVANGETAIMAFLRLVGLDVPVPRVSLRPCDVRRRWGEMLITYVRKRKAGDAGRSCGKRFLLLAPDADLVEHEQQKSLQLATQSCPPIANVEVHTGITLELQNRLATVGSFFGETCTEIPTGFTLLPNVNKISITYAQPGIDQSLRLDDGNVIEKATLALVPTELSASPFGIVLPSFDSEKSKNVHTATITKNENGTGESDDVPFHNYIVEDSDDLKKKPVLPTSLHTVLVAGKKAGDEEDLNLFWKKPGSPINNCDTKTADNMETADTIPNQADTIQDDSRNAGYYENAPTLHQENNPLDASACAKIHKNKESQILFQPPSDNKEECLLPEMKRNVEAGAFPQEATRYNCVNKRNLNSIAENREGLNLNHGEKTLNEGAVAIAKNGQDRRILKKREKSKKNGLPKDDKDQLAAKAQKDHVSPKPLPSFEDFFIEEEEVSGGYGTIYRARRQVDGKLFAIKCPHPNAHPHHVNNELKMLERFGGRNCVIKYDSSFRSGDLECFVLEHVEHDIPEILKKEINILQLQCYGHRLFRALACLHKQGIVHRDVKPGNFLFSRKIMKGYLIDFNLANDLHQKFLKNCKSETISCGKDKVSQPSLSLAPVVHAKEAIADGSILSKRKISNRSPVGSAPKIDNKSRHGSQAADASVVTSAKDPTNTKTSIDKLKEPMLYKGRKELMNFLHETMQSPNKDTSKAPVSQKKRVAAPTGSLDRKRFVLTPMPLRSSGSSVAGSGMLNNKGHGKQRREGSCVGTKGFRAPEVLFMSFHQGCKVDVWSAGVTLLYFVIGRTPFGGDREQNIKEIAKLRGSEELWEVAKLHNCESSYPSDLFDVKSLQSLDLREWCAANTRRPEFLEMIPDSLFDLVDKCLAVNPRCRLTSEDALMHEFFVPVRDSLSKQRVPRSFGSDASCSSQGYSFQ